jgi:large subunit ribosomal protein L23
MGILNKIKSKKDDETTVPAGDSVKEPKSKKKATPAKKKAPVSSLKSVPQVLVRPMLSEKTTRQEAQGQYTFVVTADATKPEVKRAIKQIYGVEPRRVNIINVEGKKKQFGRFTGRRSDWKKAIIMLPKGQNIQIHEGV